LYIGGGGERGEFPNKFQISEKILSLFKIIGGFVGKKKKGIEGQEGGKRF